MKRFPIRRLRTVVALAVFLSIVAGLILGNGWGTLSSMGYQAVAYLCPLGALETLVAEHTIIPRALVALVVALAVAALVGRAFCAWVCPVPLLQRFFRPKKDGKDAAESTSAPDAAEPTSAPDAAPSVHVPNAACSAGCSTCATCRLEPVGGKRDGLKLDSRHGVLAGALLGTAVFGFPVFCLVCPIGLSIALVVALYQAIFNQSPTISLLVFAAILLVEVVFFRKWCHRICPMGALLSLVGAKAPLAKPHVDEGACLRARGIDCRNCVRECPEHLDPHSSDLAECTRCGICAEHCPAHAITMGKPRPSSKLHAKPAPHLEPSPHPEPAPHSASASRSEDASHSASASHSTDAMDER